MIEMALYINDNGVMNCDIGGCAEPYFVDEFWKGRRGSLFEFLNCVNKHIQKYHSEKIPLHPDTGKLGIGLLP